MIFNPLFFDQETKQLHQFKSGSMNGNYLFQDIIKVELANQNEQFFHSPGILQKLIGDINNLVMLNTKGNESNSDICEEPNNETGLINHVFQNQTDISNKINHSFSFALSAPVDQTIKLAENTLNFLQEEFDITITQELSGGVKGSINKLTNIEAQRYIIQKVNKGENLSIKIHSPKENESYHINFSSSAEKQSFHNSENTGQNYLITFFSGELNSQSLHNDKNVEIQLKDLPFNNLPIQKSTLIPVNISNNYQLTEKTLNGVEADNKFITNEKVKPALYIENISAKDEPAEEKTKRNTQQQTPKEIIKITEESARAGGDIYPKLENAPLKKSIVEGETKESHLPDEHEKIIMPHGRKVQEIMMQMETDSANSEVKSPAEKVILEEIDKQKTTTTPGESAEKSLIKINPEIRAKKDEDNNSSRNTNTIELKPSQNINAPQNHRDAYSKKIDSVRNISESKDKHPGDSTNGNRDSLKNEILVEITGRGNYLINTKPGKLIDNFISEIQKIAQNGDSTKLSSVNNILPHNYTSIMSGNDIEYIIARHKPNYIENIPGKSKEEINLTGHTNVSSSNEVTNKEFAAQHELKNPFLRQENPKQNDTEYKLSDKPKENITQILDETDKSANRITHAAFKNIYIKEKDLPEEIIKEDFSNDSENEIRSEEHTYDGRKLNAAAEENKTENENQKKNREILKDIKGGNDLSRREENNLNSRNEHNPQHTVIHKEHKIEGSQNFTDEFIKIRGGARHQPELNKKLTEEISELVISDKKDKAIINLEPASLGKIKIAIEIIDNKLQAVLEVDNKAAKEILQNQSDLLRTSLNETGIQLSSLNIHLANNEQKNNRAARERKKEAASVKVDVKNGMAEENKIKSFGYNTYEFIA